VGIAPSLGDFSEWAQVFPNPRLWKVLLDPITVRVHIIETAAESYRFQGSLEVEQKRSIVAAASIELGSGRNSKAAPPVAPASWVEAQDRRVILINTGGPNMTTDAGPNQVVKGARLLHMRLGTV
jgi:hypothetical protein